MKKIILLSALTSLSIICLGQDFKLHDASTSGGITIASVSGFSETSDSILVMSQDGNGILEYDRKTGTWLQHRNSTGTNYWLGNNAYGVEVGPNDTLYVHTSKRTSVYNGTAWVAPPSGMAKGVIEVDNSGALWVLNGGTAPKFQHYFNGQLTEWDETDFPVLKGMQPNDIFADSNNDIWFATDSGVAFYDGTSLSYVAYIDSIVNKVYQDNNGDMWLVADYWFAKRQGTNWNVYNTVTKPNWPASFGKCEAIAQTKSGYTFITSGWRLFIIDPQGNPKSYDYNDTTTHMPSNANYFPDLFVDSQDHVWMSIYQKGGVIEITVDTAGSGSSGLHEVLNESLLQMYPNPASNRVTFSTSALTGIAVLQLYNEAGMLLKQEEVDPKNGALKISNLEKGVYFVKLFNDGGVLSKTLVLR